MANYDYDSSPDSDWDDSWEVVWNEFDWELYLKNEKDEIRKYQKLYSKLFNSRNRLDEVAYYMGWETINSEGDLLEPLESSPETLSDQPYTLHRHPLFIASKALHGWMTEKWMQRVQLCSEQLSPKTALSVQNAITQSDYYGLLAVTALDLGDYTLAIAYFKRGLASLNALLAELTSLESQGASLLSAFSQKAKTRVFDIREIWLRVISDCRAATTQSLDED